MKTSEQLIPQLRFSEFSKEWKLKKIGEVFKISAGGDIKNKNISKIKNKEYCYPVYANAEKNKGFYSYANVFKIDKEVVTVAGRGVNIGIAHRRREKFYPIVRLLVLEPKRNQSVDFFEYAINKLNILVESTGVPQLTSPQMASYKIKFPELPEQQKIAAFLTDVDDKITKFTKKKTLLEQYKKGIMQKIFNQDLRFKDDNGNDFADWEEKKLGDIGTFQTSSVDKLSKRDEQEAYLVNYMNVYRHEIISNETVKSYQVVTANEKQLISSNLLSGDILFTPSSETPTDIGHSVVIFEDINNAVYSYHLIRFRPSIQLNLMFSHYFCNTSDVLRQLSRFSTGSTRFTISIGNFSKVKVCYPCIEEQTKIANFLSDIDLKIEALNTKIENSKTFKKGLLQEMLV